MIFWGIALFLLPFVIWNIRDSNREMVKLLRAAWDKHDKEVAQQVGQLNGLTAQAKAAVDELRKISTALGGATVEREPLELPPVRR